MVSTLVFLDLNLCEMGSEEHGRLRFNPCFLGFEQKITEENIKEVISFNPCFLGFELSLFLFMKNI